MNTEESTFFGMVLKPKYEYKTVLKSELLLTRAIIDPDALPSQSAKLYVTIDNHMIPAACLDGAITTSLPLNIQLFSSTEIKFKVSGDVPIHISGFYTPSIKIQGPDFISAGYELKGNE